MRAFGGLRRAARRPARLALPSPRLARPSHPIASRGFVGKPLEIKHDTVQRNPNGLTVTVFGATGYVGNFVAHHFGRMGSQLVFPYRSGDGQNARHLKLSGDVGQVALVPMDLTDEDSIRNTLKDSNVVINLIGREYKTPNYSLHDANVKVPYRIAKIASEFPDIERFVHLSAMGASHDSPSEYLRAKAESEDVVRHFFPNSTILRPGRIFGHDDLWLLKRARMMLGLTRYLSYTVDGGKQKVQPVWVQDVANAIVNSVLHEEAQGQNYVLANPEIITYNELNKLIYECTLVPEGEFGFRDFPLPLAKLHGLWLEMWNLYLRQKRGYYTFSVDSWVRESMDNTVHSDHRSLRLEDLGITPSPLTRHARQILVGMQGWRQESADGLTDEFASTGNPRAPLQLVGDSSTTHKRV